MSNEVETVLKLSVQTGDGQKAMKDIAGATRDAGAAAKGAQKEFDALAEAQKRLRAQDQNRQVQQQMDRLRPPPGFDPHQQARQLIQGAEQARMVDRARQQMEHQKWQGQGIWNRSVLPPGMAGRMAAGAAPALAVGAAAHVILGGVAGGISEHGRLAAERLASTGGTVSTNETMLMFGKQLADSIPVIGHFRKQIEELGAASQRAAAQLAIAGLAVQDRIAARSAHAAGAMGEAAREQHGIRMNVGDARAAAAASAGFAASLTPGTLERYRGAFGEGQAAVDRAAFEVQAARQQVANRQGPLAAAEAELAKSRPLAAFLSKEANAAQAEADAASRAKEKWLNKWGGNNTTHQPTGRALEARERDALADAAGKVGNAAMAEAKVGENAKAVNQQLNEMQAARTRLAEQELNQQRAILGIKSQIAQGAEGRAMHYGMGGESRAFADAHLLQMAKQGIEHWSPRMIERLQGIAPEVIDPMIKARGDKLAGRFGIPGLIADLAPADQQDQIRKPRAEQVDEVQKLRAKAQEEFDQKGAATADSIGVKMSDIVEKRLQQILGAFEREQDKERQKGALLNKG